MSCWSSMEKGHFWPILLVKILFASIIQKLIIFLIETKAESANRFLVWTLNNDEDLKALIMDIEVSLF